MRLCIEIPKIETLLVPELCRKLASSDPPGKFTAISHLRMILSWPGLNWPQVNLPLHSLVRPLKDQSADLDLQIQVFTFLNEICANSKILEYILDQGILESVVETLKESVLRESIRSALLKPTCTLLNALLNESQDRAQILATLDPLLSLLSMDLPSSTVYQVLSALRILFRFGKFETFDVQAAQAVRVLKNQLRIFEKNAALVTNILWILDYIGRVDSQMLRDSDLLSRVALFMFKPYKEIVCCSIRVLQLGAEQGLAFKWAIVSSHRNFLDRVFGLLGKSVKNLSGKVWSLIGSLAKNSNPKIIQMILDSGVWTHLRRSLNPRSKFCKLQSFEALENLIYASSDQQIRVLVEEGRWMVMLSQCLLTPPEVSTEEIRLSCLKSLQRIVESFFGQDDSVGIMESLAGPVAKVGLSPGFFRALAEKLGEDESVFEVFQIKFELLARFGCLDLLGSDA